MLLLLYLQTIIMTDLLETVNIIILTGYYYDRVDERQNITFGKSIWQGISLARNISCQSKGI